MSTLLDRNMFIYKVSILDSNRKVFVEECLPIPSNLEQETIIEALSSVDGKRYRVSNSNYNFDEFVFYAFVDNVGFFDSLSDAENYANFLLNHLKNAHLKNISLIENVLFNIEESESQFYKELDSSFKDQNLFKLIEYQVGKSGFTSVDGSLNISFLISFVNNRILFKNFIYRIRKMQGESYFVSKFDDFDEYPFDTFEVSHKDFYYEEVKEFKQFSKRRFYEVKESSLKEIQRLKSLFVQDFYSDLKGFYFKYKEFLESNEKLIEYSFLD